VGTNLTHLIERRIIHDIILISTSALTTKDGWYATATSTRAGESSLLRRRT
jgi:hypothetical protein